MVSIMTPFSHLIRWYFSKRTLPYWGILLIDCVLFFLSLLTMHIVVWGFSQTAADFHQLTLTILLYLCPFLLGFKIFHTYSGIIRFSSFMDLFRVCQAMVFGAAIGTLAYYSFPDFSLLHLIKIRELLIGTIFATSLAWLLRISVKTIYCYGQIGGNLKKAFIYGTQSGGISIAKSIQNQPDSQYRICGFVTDDEKMTRRYFMGCKVYMRKKGITDIMKKKGVDVLFVSPSKTNDFIQDKEWTRKLIDYNIKIMMIPHSLEWDGSSNFTLSSLKEVEVEDLLPREVIEVNMDAIGKQLKDKTILITGAAGSIGSELVRQTAVYSPQELILIDQAETPMHDIRLETSKKWPHLKVQTIVTSITKRKRMEDIFRTYKPDYVFHAAAYKHVPMMEDDPCEAVQNNCSGTRIIADLAVKYGTKKFVMLSTDKAVNPTNVMGCSKRICEIYTQSLNNKLQKDWEKAGDKTLPPPTQFVTTRFGNVLGSNGSVIPLFREQIKNGGPVTVTSPDIIRFFMLIPEACKLVLEAGTMGKGGEIFVFDMGEPVRIADLAQRMIKLSGRKNVEIQYTGLRDGEKLYEEVLNDTERTVPTIHPKIKIAKVIEYNYEEVVRKEEELLQLSLSYDNMAVVRKMKEMVPEYKSNHSIYEQLDK